MAFSDPAEWSGKFLGIDPLNTVVRSGGTSLPCSLTPTADSINKLREGTLL